MKYSAKNNADSKIKRVLLYILAYCMIYISGTVKQMYGKVLETQLIILLFTFILAVRGYKKVNIKTAKIVFGIMAGGFLLSFNSGNNFGNYLYKLILFFCVFGSCIFFEKRKIAFEEILFQVFIFLSILSFVGFILVNFAGFVYLRSTPDGIYKDFYGIYFYSTALPVNFGFLHFNRMASIYWEPGVYAMYLCIAFCYTIFLRHRKTDKIFSVFIIINILLTKSTTGYMILALLIAVLWFYKAPVVKRERFVAGIIIAGILFVAAFAVLFMKKNGVRRAVMYDGRRYNSYEMRLLDLIVGLRLFLKHPLAGVGYYNMEEFSKLLGYDRGDSNGIITWMFQMGILGILFILLPFFKNYINIRKVAKERMKTINHLVYIVVFILANMSEPLLTLPVMVYLLAREYCKACI